jgi:hypothetical protein
MVRDASSRVPFVVVECYGDDGDHGASVHTHSLNEEHTSVLV